MLTDDEINSRVHYHRPSEAAKQRHERIREMVAETIRTICEAVPEGREQSTAITKVEEAMFWSNAGIARNHDKIPG